MRVGDREGERGGEEEREGVERGRAGEEERKG